MGKLIKFIIVLVIIIGVLVVGKNIIVKLAVEKGVTAATGLPLEIKKLDIGLLSTHIGITELSLYNPEGFPKEAMFHAPEIYVDYKLGMFIQGKVHLEDIRLDFDRFVVVKNKDGQVNLDVLKPKPKEKEADQPKTEDKTKSKKDLDLQIDHLKVRVGKVIYKDYSAGGEPSIKEFNVNISEEHTNITNSNMNWLILTVAQKALLKTTISSLVDFDLEAISDVPFKAVDTLKGTADSLKSKIKLPFGSN